MFCKVLLHMLPSNNNSNSSNNDGIPVKVVHGGIDLRGASKPDFTVDNTRGLDRDVSRSRYSYRWSSWLLSARFGPAIQHPSCISNPSF